MNSMCSHAMHVTTPREATYIVTAWAGSYGWEYVGEDVEACDSHLSWAVQKVSDASDKHVYHIVITDLYKIRKDGWY